MNLTRRAALAAAMPAYPLQALAKADMTDLIIVNAKEELIR